MKIAVCFSGTVRNSEHGLKSLNLIFPNNDIKVFGHIWKNLSNEKDHVNQTFETSEENILSSIQKFDFETLLIEDYQSKKIHFQKMYDFFNFKIWDSPPRTDIGIISMFYSIYQSNLLKRKYEITNKIKFDKVIRIRFDSNFENKVLNLEHIRGDLCIPTGNDWCEGLNDQFAVGSSDAMDLYCDMYNCFSMLRHVPYHPELMFKEYLKIKNINVDRFNFKISISSSRLSWDEWLKIR